MFSVRGGSSSLLRSCLSSLSPQTLTATRSNVLRGFATEAQRPTEVSEAFARTANLFKTYKPITPGIRHLRRPLNPHIWEGRPLRLLTVPLRKNGGRNNHGRITVRHRGGGHKRRIRLVDFVRDEPGLHDVVRIEYDPNRSAHIALIKNRNPEVDGRKKWSYILACEGLRAGSVVESFRQGIPDGFVPGYVDSKANRGKVLTEQTEGSSVQTNSGSLALGLLRAKTIRPGNVLPLRLIPTGTVIHNIALSPEGRGILVRSAGSFGQVIAHDDSGRYTQVRLQSGEVRKVLQDCCATIGKVSNPLWKNRSLGKAGRARWLGIRPTVRGVAMNANDHPHGGGRGKSKSNKHPRSPWGWLTKGKRTRKPGPKGPKNSNKMVQRAMDSPDTLRTFLQLQLATDAYAVLHLPYVLSVLSAQSLGPSEHLQKWTTRLSSLLYSKDPAARWAGLCLALQTSVLSKAIMMENAQGWIAIALPLLSKNEPVPNLKTAIRLLFRIFSAATDVPEFQRQLATPNVPKFGLALLTLADKHTDHELKILAIDVLSQLVPLYPTLLRPIQASLSSFCLRQLNGSAAPPTDPATLTSVSRLYAALPVTGGKVGAANLWRSAVDDTLNFAWDAFAGVRTTFPVEERLYAAQPRQGQTANEEALVAVPLNVDRLRCATAALCELLKFAHARPVQIPMGQLVQFCLALVRSTTEDKRDGHLDATRRAMEESVVPDLWIFGCSILDSLASSTRQHLAPHISRFVTVIVYHLEQPLPASHRLPFLRALTTLLKSSRPLHHPILPTRATKALLQPLTALLPSQSAVQTQAASTGTGSGSKSKRARKRARTYEGDEVFNIANAVMCPTVADGAVVLQSLEGVLAPPAAQQPLPLRRRPLRRRAPPALHPPLAAAPHARAGLARPGAVRQTRRRGAERVSRGGGGHDERAG
ncbi:hypothetical protein EVG20_g11035 [Dentipellis fragilis]|uniref:Large ribosomal subunit protein uL2m n=1 Tax=Dentipellis fragilis TaxID=205917 RepID=A0A4Y9XMP4_9AGAM|nr:hypothetical protein EVG20_g11035 [Dentipellis fragilis]